MPAPRPAPITQAGGYVAKLTSPVGAAINARFGAGEELVWDSAGAGHQESWPLLRAEFAAAVRSGVPGPLDAARGLRLQELIAMAKRDLAG